MNGSIPEPRATLRTLLFAALSGLSLTACFDELFLAGQPCESDAQCPIDLSCDVCCGCTMWCEDNDKDGHGSTACVHEIGEPPLPPGQSFAWVQNQDDCDDQDPRTFPGAATMEASEDACTTDADADGWAASAPTSAAATPGTDCDDDDPFRFPGAAEFDQPVGACMRDADEDGWGADELLAPGLARGADCDDEDPALFDCRDCNLLRNPSADAGVEGWTGRIETQDRWDLEGQLVEPVTGGYFFIVGNAPPFFGDTAPLEPCEADDGGHPVCRAHQIVQFDPPIPAGTIGSVGLRGGVRVWEQADMDNDVATMGLSFISADNQELPCPETVSSTLGEWTRSKIECELPNETLSGVRVTLEGRLALDADPSFNYLDAYFDDLLLFHGSCPGSSG